MRKEVDAKGEACPKPVIMTKKALDAMEEGSITTIVDNEVAKENVSKLAKSFNYEYDVEKNDEGNFLIHITKGNGEAADETIEDELQVCKPNTFKDMTVIIDSDQMGDGPEELGKVLIKGFIYTLTESLPFPSTIVFYNSGVKLTTADGQILEDLKKLEEEGVEIISCGTCLNYFGLENQLKVGEVSNMYTIVEKIKNATNTVKI